MGEAISRLVHGDETIDNVLKLAMLINTNP